MTTIVAVIKNKKVCIGTDTLATHGQRKESVPTIVPEQAKVVCWNGVYIGASGFASWDLVFNSYCKRYQSAIDFTSIDGILETLCDLHRVLKRDYFLTPLKLKKDLFESSEYTLLLASKLGIFEIEWDRTIRQFSKMAAIGSGEEYALGAMKAIYDNIENPLEIARLGIEAAAKFDRRTALPAVILSC